MGEGRGGMAPMLVQDEEQLLGPAQGKHRDEAPPAALHDLVGGRRGPGGGGGANLQAARE